MALEAGFLPLSMNACRGEAVIQPLQGDGDTILKHSYIDSKMKATVLMLILANLPNSFLLMLISSLYRK